MGIQVSGSKKGKLGEPNSRRGMWYQKSVLSATRLYIHIGSYNGFTTHSVKKPCACFTTSPYRKIKISEKNKLSNVNLNIVNLYLSVYLGNKLFKKVL